MAVFTPVTLEDLHDWIKPFSLGAPLSVTGIHSGIENSNFFLTTETGEYVLTLFEVLTFEQLPFYLHLMSHLAKQGVLVPAPIPDQQGHILHTLLGKPAAIVTKLEGDHQHTPTSEHCAAVGAMLARMHLAGQNFSLIQPNLRGRTWWNHTSSQVLPFLSWQQQHRIRAELQFQNTFMDSPLYHTLPTGPIHADLFRNNVMFSGNALTGFFDFYFAGWDTWLFDVAVTINDWCIDQVTGALEPAKTHALLNAYHHIRPFQEHESLAWQPILRSAALRFWLSRLYDLHLPRAASLLTPHDPTHFEQILQQRIHCFYPLPS